MRARAALAAAAALAVLATGCGGSGSDKAGGHAETTAGPVGKPVTLTLVAVDTMQSGWVSEFVDAAWRLSGGAIRIEVRGGGNAIVDYERRLIERVRDGEGDLAEVGARAWDRMGVTSFRALVAPFLVDSLELEGRVLRSSLVQPMLDGIEPLGLVGLAVLPGPLRMPFSLSRPLRGPRDYAGATIGIRYGGVARDTIEALGARPKGYRIRSLVGVDGAELDPATIAGVGYDAPGSALTANVVLWARPETVVISRAAFDRLSPAQQEVLRRAGREAVAPVLARVEKEQAEGVRVFCDRGKLTLATASPSDLAALRAAVQPVYDELERDPQTKRLIAGIRELDDGAGSRALRCPASEKVGPDGIWEANVAPAALLGNGASAVEAATYRGRGTLELRNGRWTFRNGHTTVKGTYTVAGDMIRMTMRTCTANPCSPGASSDYTWSVYRDTLTLARRDERPYWPRLVAKPAHRVG
jgi:TRAP-type C4-dicarboxylate transport system substrate-binding protein